MTTTVACRRSHTRYRLGRDSSASVEFDYPFPGAQPCSMPLRDISASGLSFLVARELPGLEEGRSIEAATILLGDQEVRVDLLVMHLTPDPGPGSVCGALIYPQDDEGVRALQQLLETLESLETGELD